METTPELFSLKNKVAFVTGGGGLLGEQHALALAQCGATVVVTDVNRDSCEARVKSISTETGQHVVALECNVGEKDSWEKAVDHVVSDLGGIDILVNNAAYTNQSKSSNYSASFSDFPLEDWNQIMHVNLTGQFLGCQVVGSHMLERKQGSIINIASMYGVVSPNHKVYPGTGISQPVAYSVSKAGVIALTRYLGTLWAQDGVRVNCITPGGIYDAHSQFFLERYQALSPIGRMADKSEMRGALIYLASRASSYCAGHNLIVDGGWTTW